jgi:hypothetical protein
MVTTGVTELQPMLDPFVGEMIAEILESSPAGGGGAWQPFDVVKPIRSGAVVIAVIILAHWSLVNRIMQRSSA